MHGRLKWQKQNRDVSRTEQNSLRPEWDLRTSRRRRQVRAPSDQPGRAWPMRCLSVTSGRECRLGMRKWQVVRPKRRAGPGWAGSCEPQWSVCGNRGTVLGLLKEGDRAGSVFLKTLWWRCWEALDRRGALGGPQGWGEWGQWPLWKTRKTYWT